LSELQKLSKLFFCWTSKKLLFIRVRDKIILNFVWFANKNFKNHPFQLCNQNHPRFNHWWHPSLKHNFFLLILKDILMLEGEHTYQRHAGSDLSKKKKIALWVYLVFQHHSLVFSESTARNDFRANKNNQSFWGFSLCRVCSAHLTGRSFSMCENTCYKCSFLHIFARFMNCT
jgi:hypothetical protein